MEEGGPTKGLNQIYRKKTDQSKPEAGHREGEVSTTYRQLGNMTMPNRPKYFYIPRGNLTQPGMRPSRGNEAEVSTERVRLPQGPVDKKRLSRR